MAQNQDHAYKSQGAESDRAQGVEAFGEGKALRVLEAFPSGADQMCCNTGIATRGFAKSNETAFGNLGTAHLAGMDVTSVVAAGSWCCPGVDCSCSDLNAHRVSSFHSDYLAPSNFKAMEGIDNDQALVVDLYRWSMKDQVEGICDTDAAHKGENKIAQRISQQSLNDKNTGNQVHDPRRYDAGFAAKDLAVGHASILSQGAVNV